MKYVEADPENFVKTKFDSWEDFKDHVFIRLINKKIVDIQSEFDNVIKVPFMDLYKLFYVREVDRKKDVVRGYTLKQDDMKRWNVKFKKLSQQASNNMNSDRKRRVKTFKDSIVADMKMGPILRIPDHFKDMIAVGGSGGVPASIEDPKEDTDPQNVLIITNSMDVFGTSYMTSSKVIDELYRAFRKENFYMLSMSQHRLMAIREGYISEEKKIPRYEYEDDLFTMLDDLNNDVSNWKDVLSYRLYYFMGDDGKTIMSLKEH